MCAVHNECSSSYVCGRAGGRQCVGSVRPCSQYGVSLVYIRIYGDLLYMYILSTL